MDERILDTISCAISNNYESQLLKNIKTNQNLVVLGFDERIHYMLKLCKNNGWKVSHVCYLGIIDSRTELLNTHLVSIEEVYALQNSTTVLVCNDPYFAVSFITLLRQHGKYNAMVFPPVDNCKDDEKKIIANLQKVWQAFNLFDDEVSKRTYLSLIKYRITGDLTVLFSSDFPQYFHDMVRPERGDTIIDGGAYDGDTGITFLKAVAGHAKIIGFEPNINNHKLAKMRISSNGFADKYDVIDSGLGEFTQIAYIGENGAGSKIHEDETPNSQRVNIISIDQYCKENADAINLIKLDVEGYEMSALRGARNVIARFSPKLQICVYHKMEDLWELPLFINRLSGRYSFFLAHHSISRNDYDFEKCLSSSQYYIVNRYGFYELVTCWETILYCLPH